MGVWIETGIGKSAASVIKSHPVWVCGLKLLGNAKRSGVWGVTPCMGVWIET